MFPEVRCFSRRCASGVTLIELLVVVSAIAILGAVALPAYQASVRKAHRSDAKSALTEGAQRMQRAFTERGTYATATLGTASPTTDVYRSTSENKYYALTLTNQTATTFTLNATPQGAQAADECGTYTLTQAGARGVTGGSLSPEKCW